MDDWWTSKCLWLELFTKCDMPVQEQLTCLNFCLPCGSWQCWVSNGAAVLTWWYWHVSVGILPNNLLLSFFTTPQSWLLFVFERMLIVCARWLGSSSSIIKGYNMVPMGSCPNSCYRISAVTVKSVWYRNNSQWAPVLLIFFHAMCS